MKLTLSMKKNRDQPRDKKTSLEKLLVLNLMRLIPLGPGNFQSINLQNSLLVGLRLGDVEVVSIVACEWVMTKTLVKGTFKLAPKVAVYRHLPLGCNT